MWYVLSVCNDVMYTLKKRLHFVMKWLVCLCVTELVHDDTTEIHQLKKFVCTIHQTLVYQLPRERERDRKPINTIASPISLRFIILTPILSAIMDFCRSPIPSITTILSWSYTIEENEFTFKTHILQFHTQLYLPVTLQSWIFRLNIFRHAPIYSRLVLFPGLKWKVSSLGTRPI